MKVTEKRMLQVGDNITERSHYGIESISVVERVTPTQAITKTGQKFLREISGSRLRELAGKSWSISWYSPTTQEDYQEMELKEARLALINTNWSKVSNEVVLQVLRLIEPQKSLPTSLPTPQPTKEPS